jgi:YVTN family beta-propeller protein
MTLEKTWIRRVVLLGAFAAVTTIAVAQTPSSALLVVNKGEDSMAIVDPKTRKVVGKVTTAGRPHEVTVSPDGKMAFTANMQNNTLSVIDVVGQKVVRHVDLGALTLPHGIDFAGGKVYFTAQGAKAIGRYDPATNKIDLVLGTGQDGTHTVVVSKDLKHIFAANMAANSMAVFERTEKPADWKLTTIPVGKRPEGIDISADGKELWVAHSDAVSIIDIATKKVKETFNVQTKVSNKLTFTPDGKRVLISDNTGNELVVLDAATRKQIKRLKLGNKVTKFQVEPDGSRVYVANADDNVVVTIDLKTFEEVGRFSTGIDPDGMAWTRLQ